jgi:hypothetical protein
MGVSGHQKGYALASGVCGCALPSKPAALFEAPDVKALLMLPNAPLMAALIFAVIVDSVMLF